MIKLLYDKGFCKRSIFRNGISFSSKKNNFAILHYSSDNGYNRSFE